MHFQPAGPVTRLAPSHYLQSGFDRNLDPDYNITKSIPFPSNHERRENPENPQRIL